MLIQVLDVDYIMPNEKPVVRVFGKDKNGKVVCCFFEKLMPYFYVLGNNVENVVRGERNVARIEKVKRYLATEYRKDSIEVYKITLHNPAKTPELRDKLRNLGYEVFEADIPFKYRFMIDYDIRGMCWIDVENGNGIDTNTVYADKIVRANKIRSVDLDANAPLKYLAFDIECVSTKPGAVPNAKRDGIIMISIVFSEPFKGKKEMVLSTRYDASVEYFQSEEEMLREFVNILIEYDPDIITGYNVNNFDLPYVLERLRQNNIPALFGRCRDKYVVARKIANRYKINITGRIVVDSYELIKKDFSLKRYDLDFVCNALLGERKVPVRHSEIEKLWKGNSNDFKKLIRYSKMDSILALNLLFKLNLLDKYIALAKISGTLLQDILDSGETTRIENYLLREFSKKGYIIPCKPLERDVAKREAARKKELKGGYVLEPEKGLQESVIVLDFKSMYPSLIRTYNICPTTLLVSNEGIDCFQTPAKVRFVKPNIKEGIVPSILKTLMDERGKIKAEMKNEKDGAKLRELDAKQWALKIMANAFYGYFGYPRSRMYNLGIANSITSLGRETIKKTKALIEKEFGYKVVYGDTDSVMVRVDVQSLEEMKKIGDKLSSYISNMLPGIMELEFEKIFKRFLPLTKKRYAAWCFELKGDKWVDKIETKGIETVRRDWCDLVSETMMKIIEIILKEKNTTNAVEYFKNIVEKINKGEIPIQKFIITKTMTKTAESYDGIQPHAEVVKKIKKRNPAEAPGIGDRIAYVITKGTQMLSKRAEPPEYVVEHGLELDSQYYIENQLLPPLERIFSALNISKNELLGKGRQIQLLKFNNKNKKMVARIEDVEAFICKSCEKVYKIPPLNGTCECGGTIAFMTPKGSLDHVTLT
ncbi:MAG TPA: hypothetical protein ENG42_03730 [Candidatus Aenigmarchaeota archaeon]|nr:MAG: hypothetical protein DRP03_01045 [Candidatus Aenigmarchaeota archaeon]HDD46562.1 hypothetical protein [Candidatus Aenigmarchaeota archaeon]